MSAFSQIGNPFVFAKLFTNGFDSSLALISLRIFIVIGSTFSSVEKNLEATSFSEVTFSSIKVLSVFLHEKKASKNDIKIKDVPMRFISVSFYGSYLQIEVLSQIIPPL